MHLVWDGDDGSSPHTRGALGELRVAHADVGIIPAYAGSTRADMSVSGRGEDHPRIRGEHAPIVWLIALKTGSSPHTRGAPERAGGPPAAQGIIPAYAGSTPSRSPPAGMVADHPRIRGEHTRSSTRPTEKSGSSPHTRGARRARQPGALDRRIIPAYAGSTPASPTGSSPGRDHPRIRGEHYGHLSVLRDNVGSSPHTRGAHVGGGRSRLVERIIPAYAGSTMLLPIVTKVTGDHPRIRGEHSLVHTDNILKPGSSPHTRGAPILSYNAPWTIGIIPAYAGSTRSSLGTRSTGSDHPRIRGEHNPHLDTAKGSGGSSPHTRGALFWTGGETERIRIIPAYAGSTFSPKLRFGS